MYVRWVSQQPSGFECICQRYSDPKIIDDIIATKKETVHVEREWAGSVLDCQYMIHWLAAFPPVLASVRRSVDFSF